MRLKEILFLSFTIILVQTQVSAQNNRQNVHSKTLRQSSHYNHRPANRIQPQTSEDYAGGGSYIRPKNRIYKNRNGRQRNPGYDSDSEQYAVNQPMRKFMSSSVSGIQLTMNLVKFVNPKLLLQTEEGDFLCKYEGADLDKNCIVYFSLLFTDASGQIMLKSGNVMWGSDNHQLDLDTGEFDFENSTMWFSQSLTFQFSSRPSTMLFIVYGMGNMVDSKSVFRQGAAVMEYFVHNLTDVTPGQLMVLTYHGAHSSDNSLDLSFQLDCDYATYGSTCNMTGCKSVSGTSDVVQCTSQATPGDVFVCTVHSGSNVANSQNCTQCPTGLSGKFCYNEVKDGTTADIFKSLEGERNHFRTATIVLGVFFGLMFLVAAVLIVFIVLLMHSDKSSSRATRDSGPVYRAPPNANPPLKDSGAGGFAARTEQPRSDRAREWNRPEAAPAAVRSAARNGSSSSGNHRSSPVNSSHSNNSLLGGGARPYTDV